VSGVAPDRIMGYIPERSGLIFSS